MTLMDVAITYTKTHLRILLNHKIVIVQTQLVHEVSYDDTHTKSVCGKAILMYLIPILVGIIYDGIICSKTPS